MIGIGGYQLHSDKGTLASGDLVFALLRPQAHSSDLLLVIVANKSISICWD